MNLNSHSASYFLYKNLDNKTNRLKEVIFTSKKTIASIENENEELIEEINHLREYILIINFASTPLDDINKGNTK